MHKASRLIERIVRGAVMCCLLPFVAAAQTDAAHGRAGDSSPQHPHTMKMRVEIWSDIVCPFCYLGKRKFEAALAQFAQRDSIEVEYKSFQLAPDIVTDTALRVDEYLSTAKGIPLEQARAMNARVTAAASEIGLDYQMEKAILANTFNAHRLLHMAKEHGVQQQLNERLLRAYFTEGLNIDDQATLVRLAVEVGLPASDVAAVLTSNAHADAVRADIDLARSFGCTGVPFYVFDRTYAVSGAQDQQVFLETLRQAYAEFTHKERPRE